MIVLPSELDTAAFHEAWQAWQQHRREKRQALTPTSMKRQLTTLKAVGVANAIAAIDRSIEMGWTGVFPENLPPRKPTITEEDKRTNDERLKAKYGRQ